MSGILLDHHSFLLAHGLGGHRDASLRLCGVLLELLVRFRVLGLLVRFKHCFYQPLVLALRCELQIALGLVCRDATVIALARSQCCFRASPPTLEPSGLSAEHALANVGRAARIRLRALRGQIKN